MVAELADDIHFIIDHLGSVARSHLHLQPWYVPTGHLLDPIPRKVNEYQRVSSSELKPPQTIVALFQVSALC